MYQELEYENKHVYFHLFIYSFCRLTLQIADSKNDK